MPFALLVALSIGLLFLFAPARRAKVAPAGALSLDAPLPVKVPAGVVLRVGDPVNKWIFRHLGWDKRLPFRIEWAEITGGPGVTEAFHAGALDVGYGANVPPIHAKWSGIPVRIVGFGQFPQGAAKALYVIGIAPGAHIRSLRDLKGKRIAFSRSQVQAQVVLQTLKAEGIDQRDVSLVELPSSIGGDVYTSALASDEVDAAPLGAGLVAHHYITKFGDRGASLLPHPRFRDSGLVLFVPESVLADPGKAAALRLYVEYWGKALAWANAHPEELARGYYVGVRGLPIDDARLQVHALGPVSAPESWNDAVDFEQKAIDILGPATGRPKFDAASLFDRRFEAIAAHGMKEEQACTPCRDER
ncbi:ABC transporter substrate-binding protein [Sphingomonas morindae]|uniref:ABC transporter substrate-binding protein n=1 Tax=Sphingomonas morindae TaxID=1541170 RepID=A0ABY4XCI2_9SPHN|nr:ABC transporter substrate-binding protein [Sphingomonas morindae]USI74683.1 ABC transporter substrate-binding protein [Sphingomonas morindae]